MYFLESPQLKLGIVILTKEKNFIVASGNKTIAKYPEEMFAKDIFASIDNCRFRIVPPEALVLEAKFSKFEADKTFGMNLEIDPELFDQIKTIKLRE